MELSSVAATVSAQAASRVQQEASLLVLKKAMDIQANTAMQLVQALPPVQSAPTGTVGGIVDTFA